ncbi:ABC transporter permease [Lacticaseibacillus thailandensis]|nr:ABC transporter permease [Lacticaseibacillus thailandensis]
MKTEVTNHVVRNTMTLAHRNLLKTVHDPDSLSDVVVQPIIFTLLFGYLFGGAIAGSVHAYLPMLVPGILVQSILNAASGSGQQLRTDINSGVFDRFKTLPISPLAPLAGQLVGDVLRLLVSGVMALLTATMMGWRSTASFPAVVAALLLAIFIGWSISWVFALVGLLAKDAEMIGSLSMIIILVMTFLSNAFIPTRTLPRLMQTLVKLNPVSMAVTAIRGLMGTGTWGIDASVVLVSGGVLMLAFVPLTMWAYRRLR